MTMIYDQDCSPKTGSLVVPDGWGVGQRLEDGMTCGDWQCQFYLPTGHRYGITQLACNVHVTGRTIQLGPCGQRRVRVQIVWIGDGEPNKPQGGWLYI